MKSIFTTLILIGILPWTANAKMPIGKLGMAIQSNNVKEVKELLDQGEPPNGYNTYSVNYIPLIDAASKGFDEIVVILLDHGADINKHSGSYPDGTAITAAASLGNINTIKLLLSRGADPKGAYEAAQKRIAWYQKITDMLKTQKNAAEQSAAANP